MPQPTHKVTCVYEPRGSHGLVGYKVGETYDASRADGYWRVWPIAGQHYYEVCGAMAFNKYFEVQSPDV